MYAYLWKRDVVVILTVLLIVFLGNYRRGESGPGAENACQGDPSLYSVDCNGDGSVDISDAVHLLSWLFISPDPPRVCLAGIANQDNPTVTLEQAEILSHMSLVNVDDGQGGEVKTIRFTDVNVQIVNGLGATNGNPDDFLGPAATNGAGNLIVGYNEFGNFTETDNRSGSHNIVVGARNNYSSFGGLVVGLDNIISGEYAAVGGGNANEAAGDWSSVAGGTANRASGNGASVTGGANNEAEGLSASVTGGSGNRATNIVASVNGGFSNLATGRGATIAGGESNEATGVSSSVSGGSGNSARNEFATVSGGQGEVIDEAGGHAP